MHHDDTVALVTCCKKIPYHCTYNPTEAICPQPEGGCVQLWCHNG